MRSISYLYINRTVLILLLALAGSLIASSSALAGPPEAVLHTFNSYADGYNPQASLIQGSDGNLYGTTYSGGANGYGTVFVISTSGKIFNTLHSFDVSDGSYPSGGLIQGSDGNLYGTAYQGGSNNLGSVFELTTNGKTFTTLYNFVGSPTDGANPEASLLEGLDGNLYGTTYTGGVQSEPDLNVQGTIFQLQTQLPHNSPSITSFSPATVKVGGSVNVIGLYLANATSVTINGVAQTITSDNTKSLKFKVTTGTKTGLIVVTTLGGTASSSTQLVID